VSFYLQRPEPGGRVAGAETHAPNGLYMTERFDPPLALDLRRLPDEPVSGETTMVIRDADEESIGGRTASPSRWWLRGGGVRNTAHLHLTAAERRPRRRNRHLDRREQAVVRPAPAHVFDSLELASPWAE